MGAGVHRVYYCDATPPMSDRDQGNSGIRTLMDTVGGTGRGGCINPTCCCKLEDVLHKLEATNVYMCPASTPRAGAAKIIAQPDFQ